MTTNSHNQHQRRAATSQRYEKGPNDGINRRLGLSMLTTGIHPPQTTTSAPTPMTAGTEGEGRGFEMHPRLDSRYVFFFFFFFFY